MSIISNEFQAGSPFDTPTRELPPPSEMSARVGAELRMQAIMVEYRNGDPQLSDELRFCAEEMARKPPKSKTSDAQVNALFELAEARRERDEARKERDEARKERDAAVAEQSGASTCLKLQRDATDELDRIQRRTLTQLRSTEEELDEARKERDEARKDYNRILCRFSQACREREEARKERDEARAQRAAVSVMQDG